MDQLIWFMREQKITTSRLHIQVTQMARFTKKQHIMESCLMFFNIEEFYEEKEELIPSRYYFRSLTNIVDWLLKYYNPKMLLIQ